LFSACTVRSFSYHDLLYLDHCVPLVVTWKLMLNHVTENCW
jgi:hypothetical protein